MKGILLAASINAFHANINTEQFDALYQEQLGLRTLGESGLKMTINCHGIDFMMFPWLRECLDKYDNLQLAGGLFAHVIPALFSKNYIKWQIEEGKKTIGQNIDISFFPEFCNPENPKDNFWILDSQNHYYSLENDMVTWKNPTEISAPAINLKGKIGLVMKEAGYKPILDLFFLAQRLPDEMEGGRSNLDRLIDQIAAVNEVVIWPLDLEAVYAGSLLGESFWKRFVAKIKERKLESFFLDFNEAYASLKEQSERTKDIPHRNLVKWTSLPATFSLYAKINNLSQVNPLSTKEKYLLSIAGGADLAAAIYQKSCKKKTLAASLPDGKPSSISISGSEDIIVSAYAALDVLASGGSFAKKLLKKNRKGIFWKRLIEVSERLEL